MQELFFQKYLLLYLIFSKIFQIANISDDQQFFNPCFNGLEVETTLLFV